MVFTETLSEILWSALSSLQLEFHLHQVLGRELICVPKLRLCHHLKGAPQDVPACTGVKNDLKYDTTRFLRSRTCTPIPFLSPSNESLMLPFCLISETKWREDNDFLFVSFHSQRFGFISPGIFYILEMLVCCSSAFFHSTSPNAHQGSRGSQWEGQSHQDLSFGADLWPLSPHLHKGRATKNSLISGNVA